MVSPGAPKLSRREREIMDVVYRLERPTASEIAAAMPDPPSYSAVRAMLAILVSKGHLVSQPTGNRYVYMAAVPRKVARKHALRDVITNFFEGSPKQAVVALLDDAQMKMTPEEIDEIKDLLASARSRGKL